MAADFKELAGYQNRLKAFASNVQYQEAFGSLYAGLATPFDEIAQLQGWYADLYIRLRPSAQPLIDALETLPSETLRFLSIQAEQNAPIVGLLRTLAAEADGLPFDRRAIGNLRNDTSIADLTIELGRVATILQETVEALGPVHFREHVTVETMSSALEHATTFRNVEQQLNHDGNVSALLGRGYCGCQTGREGLKVTLGLIDNVCCDSVPTGIQNWLLTEEYSTRVSVLDEHLQSLNDHLSQYWTLWVDFMEFAQLDEQVWYGSPKGEWKDLSLEMVCTRLDRALIDPLALSVWLEYVRSRKTLEDAYLPTIISLAEQGQLKPAELQAAYDFSIYNGLSSLILKTFPMLLSFSRSRHEKIRDQFVKLDNQLLDLNRQRAAYEISRRKVPSGTGNGPVRDYTDRALLEHEIQKQRGHIPIRALINRAHLALLGLKPCFMMGPMSVAQYLEPGKFHFDLIVMDEASQLKPEDALGAIARGSQVIIVGDPKQLPPTSFFDMMFVEQNGTEEEDDSLAIEDSESILDRASEIYRPIRQLRWHYRSRHESLIAFSNHRFYDQNLILFPSPQRNSSSLGIKFHFVQEGVYSSRTNRPEADQLVQAILAHMANHPNESLGVATFNTTQRDLIEALLYEKVKNDPVAQAYEAKWKDEAEPFFIKNLETVQGDERDCIFISFTYGRDEKGVMYQRFGPINGTNGHRRLNVLFTRSKLRTEVFTSMQPEDINVGSESSLGLKALRGYLVYAKTGVLEQAELGIGPEPNDFELAVGNALKTRGLDIVAQVGVAGYFIDLAVCHPKKQGSYILGVECDGATYHSAKSARDRDRLRQSNLENMGWRIHRVWSTDWLRNRSAEVERIAQLVHNILRAEELMHN